MDEAAIEAERPDPDPPWLNEIRGIKSKTALADLYSDADRLGIGIPYRMFVGQDRKASDRYALNVLQGGLGMPDRDYYLSADPKLAETRAKYLQHLTNVLTLAGEQNAAARAKSILDLRNEHRQGAVDHGPKAATPTRPTTSSRWPRCASSRRDSILPALVKADGADVDNVIVVQPSAFNGISATRRHGSVAGAEGPAAGALARRLCGRIFPRPSTKRISLSLGRR